MATQFPILIGITGKRTFDKDPKRDRAIARRLSRRLCAVFAALDDDFPRTPKILLTGAAFGADLVAAEAALARGDDWGVAAILPFGRTLFEEDFDAPPDADGDLTERHAEHRRAFAALVARDERVLVCEMPKLDPVPGGTEATQETLTRNRPDRDEALRQLRHNHYEQVGQLIAEMSTILIAAMPRSERPDRTSANGGTARIVACRRAGYPDALGEAVAARSKVLRRSWQKLAAPPAAGVWLIDPLVPDRTGRYPVKALPPLSDRPVHDVYCGLPGKDMPAEHQTYVGPLRRLGLWLRRRAGRFGVAGPGQLADRHRLEASLAVARRFERYHADAKAIGTDAPPKADVARVASACDALERARSALSARARHAKTRSTWSFGALAVLFVSAVASLEVFAKFLASSAIALFVYLVVLLAIAATWFCARWRLWQTASEEYRAVAEMLRVQRMWWSAGLRARGSRALAGSGSGPRAGPGLRDRRRRLDRPALPDLRRAASRSDGLDTRARHRVEAEGAAWPARVDGGLDRRPVAIFLEQHRTPRGAGQDRGRGELAPVRDLGRSRRHTVALVRRLPGESSVRTRRRAGAGGTARRVPDLARAGAAGRRLADR